MAKRGQKLSAETRAKISRKQKENYADPRMREQASRARRKVSDDPEVRRRISEGVKRHYADERNRERAAKRNKESHQTPAYRAKVSERQKKYYADPEKRKLAGERAKRAYEDPALRAKVSEIQRQRFQDDPEAAERISQGQIRRFRRMIEETKEQPTSKRCSCCGETKTVAAFYSVKYRLRSGLIAIRPSSWCRKCTIAKVKARRERQEAEGIDVRARHRLWESHCDPERRRRRGREWETARRREEGRPARGPYRRKNGKRDPEPEVGETLLAAPIAGFVRQVLEAMPIGELSQLTGVPERRLYGLRVGETEKVMLRTVDMILTGLGQPEQFAILYPDLSVGYHYLEPDGRLVA